MIKFIKTRWKEIVIGVLVTVCTSLVYVIFTSSVNAFYVTPKRTVDNSKSIERLTSVSDSLCRTKLDKSEYQKDQAELKKSIDDLNSTLKDFSKDIKDIYKIMITNK